MLGLGLGSGIGIGGFAVVVHNETIPKLAMRVIDFDHPNTAHNGTMHICCNPKMTTGSEVDVKHL